MAYDQAEKGGSLPPSVENLQGGLVYLIPTVHWLHDITREYRKNGYDGPDFTLGTVPDGEWVKLRDKGVNIIYFMARTIYLLQKRIVYYYMFF